MIEDSLKIICWIIPDRTLFTKKHCLHSGFLQIKKTSYKSKKKNNFPQLWVVMTLSQDWSFIFRISQLS